MKKLITEKEKAEDALLEKEVHYRNLANAGKALIWTSGIDKLCSYFNEPWLKFTGRTLEQEIGNGWAEGLHPDDFAFCLETYISAFEKQKAFEMEYRLRHASGEYRWILDLGTPNYNKEDEFIGYIGHCFDITERKQLEIILLKKNQELATAEEEIRAANEELGAANEELNANSEALKLSNEVLQIAKEKAEESETRYRLLFENMTTGFQLNEVIYDAAGNAVDFKILDVNKYFDDFSGLSHKLVIGKTIKEVMPQVSDEYVKKYCQVGITGIPQTYEYYSNAFNKHIKFSSYSPQKNQFVCIYEDITERKLTEEKQRESEINYTTLFNTVKQAIYIQNPDLTFIDVNQGAIDMYGFEREYFIGKTPEFLSAPGKNDLNRVGELVTLAFQGKPQKYQFWGIKKDGTIFPKEVETVKGKYFGKDVLVTLANDISEREQAEEFLRDLAVAENTNKIKDQFLANMSHEIRTPLSGIIGMTEILSSTYLDETQSEYLYHIKNSSDHLLTILNDILDISKIEAGKMELHPAAFVVAKFKNKLHGNFAGFLKGKSLKLIIDYDQNLPEQMVADEKRLTQIVNNILSNAVKFSNEGVIEVKWEKAEVISCEKVKYKIQISDTGIGIKQADAEKLFSKFTQIDSSSTRSNQGTGLGLIICKELVQLMDGDIGVISQEGKGSTFWFTFEAGIVTENIHIAENAETTLQAIIKAKVLVVEDVSTNRIVASIMLKKLGCKVTMAADGLEALEVFEEGKFDIVLMDIQMPGMDGVEATSALREKYKTLPVIIGLSANAMEGDAQKYIEQGLDDYMTKPLTMDKLSVMLGKWVKH